MLGFIGSTGRTATTYLASALNSVDGVCGCHEGYAGSDKDADAVLPLLNIENNNAYQKREKSSEIIAEKRNLELLSDVRDARGATHLIDVAYYNAMFAQALVELNASVKFAAIIRDCEAFVRSATCMEGEDLLPVGWPDADKELSAREKFISFGRIRPRKDSADREGWKALSAIEKNIWLWRETNSLLLEACEAKPQQAKMFRFESIKSQGEDNLLWQLGEFFGLSGEALVTASQRTSRSDVNKKTSGYQIPAADKWTASQQEALQNAVTTIEERLDHVERG